MTAQEFLEQFGRKPERDDLERVNCPKAGEILHLSCGVCPEHKRPMFECGCGFRKMGEFLGMNDSLK